MFCLCHDSSEDGFPSTDNSGLFHRGQEGREAPLITSLLYSLLTTSHENLMIGLSHLKGGLGHHEDKATNLLLPMINSFSSFLAALCQ